MAIMDMNMIVRNTQIKKACFHNISPSLPYSIEEMEKTLQHPLVVAEGVYKNIPKLKIRMFRAVAELI